MSGSYQDGFRDGRDQGRKDRDDEVEALRIQVRILSMPKDARDANLIRLTPELMKEISDSLTARHADIAERYPKLVEACPYEMKLAVTAWVMRAIVEHAHGNGSFRHLIYHRLGFEPDAYVPLYNAGGMTISNEFTLEGKSESGQK